MQFKLLPLILLFLAAGDAAALGLGEISLHSRLGARLRAEIELVGVSANESISADCFRLNPSTDPDSGVPALRGGRVAIDRQNGKPRLLVSSDYPVYDPVLNIRLRAGCSAEVVRDYMLIIDPAETTLVPGTHRGSALSGNPDSLRAGDGALGATNIRSMAKSAHRPARSKRASLKSDQPASESGLVRFRTDKPDAAHFADRLSISGSGTEAATGIEEPSLRLATELSDPASTHTTEGQRTVLRLEYKVLTAIYDQASQQLSMAERVRQLESSFAELRAITERIASPVAQNQAPPTSTVAPTASEPSAAKLSRRSAEISPRATSGWIGIFGWSALISVIALLVWILRRYAVKAAQPAVRLIQQRAPVVQDTLPPVREAVPPKTGEVKKEYVRQDPLHQNDLQRLGQDQRPPTSVREVAPETAYDATALGEQKGFNPVLELADIMLAFGRIKGAAEALLEYIEASPKEALQPWIKLLDIYRQNGMRQEYESLSQKLRLHFNVAPADWETIAELPPPPDETGDEGAMPFAALLSRLPSIGRIEHVRDEIARTWGSPESLSYVDKLLRDNRQGERQGFALSTVNELLFLMGVLEKRFRPS